MRQPWRRFLPTSATKSALSGR